MADKRRARYGAKGGNLTPQQAKKQLTVPLYAVMTVMGVGVSLFYLAVGQGALIPGELGFGAENPLAGVESPLLLSVGLLLPSLIGLLLLTPPARRAFSRLSPMDPDSPVHAVALSLSMLVVVNLSFTLGIGLQNLTDLLAAQEVEGVQSVTLGALSPFDRDGKPKFGEKRHPDVEDDVIIYANATILGGSTVIGERAIIGGNTWIVESVPPDTVVARTSRFTESQEARTVAVPQT